MIYVIQDLAGRQIRNAISAGASVRLVALLSLLGACSQSVLAAEVSTAATARIALPQCPLGDLAVSPDGVARLAFVVGVGVFRNTEITPINAPRLDVEAMVGVLTGRSGYGFPQQNVCVLRDAAATRANFIRLFQASIVERLRKLRKGAPIEVVIYFSGHGSYAKDNSGDELDDGLDELLVLHDSWADGVAPLRDDQLNRMIAAAHEFTRNITVILDSCHSGSATKVGFGLGTDDVVNKLTPPLAGDVPDDDAGPTPGALDGVTRLSAARDGSLALAPRENGVSFFTQALLATVTGVNPAPLRWSQVRERMKAMIDVLTHGRQSPVFQGDLGRLVFSAPSRARPFGWEVTAVEASTVTLAGAPLPAWGEGAELRVYDGAADRAVAADPAKSKATLLISEFRGIQAIARFVGSHSEVRPGDIAVLSVASTRDRRLSVVLETQGERALAAGLAASIEKRLTARDDVREVIALSRAAGGFKVERHTGSSVAVRGPEGEIRRDGIQANADAVLDVLASFARQRALLTIEGESGSTLQNNESLRVRLVNVGPASGPQACTARARSLWRQQCPNEEHIVPDCADWTIEVANVSKIPLRVGGAVLLNDGGIQGLPYDGSEYMLPPDGKFRPFGDVIVHSSAPLNIPEYVVVFGTDKSVDINWAVITNPMTTTKGLRGSTEQHPLQIAFRGIMLGTKGGSTSAKHNTSAWTSTRLPYRVLANPQYEERDAAAQSCGIVDTKEYTIRDFDLNPYLPQQDSPLRTVLLKGRDLAASSGPGHSGDGIPYRQHSWSLGTGKALSKDDDLNLSYGIDCSRAIWYVFARSGLPYTSSKWHDGYLPTSQMMEASAGSCALDTPAKSPMREQFDDCTGKPLKTGDVLVFQGRRPGGNACVGHTVMVIDPAQYVAWGSHGWDGSTDDAGLKLNDTGVEYQKIMRGGWAKWDRREFRLKACWRYRAFGEQ